MESNYNPGAVSPKGAQGLMQLIPETARRFGVLDSFDPVENIQGGAKYLKYLLDLYKGDYPRALAAYNAGPERVQQYGRIPPYVETNSYVRRVQKNYLIAKKPAKSQTEKSETDRSGGEKSLNAEELFPGLKAAPAANAAPDVNPSTKP